MTSKKSYRPRAARVAKWILGLSLVGSAGWLMWVYRLELDLWRLRHLHQPSAIASIATQGPAIQRRILEELRSLGFESVGDHRLRLVEALVASSRQGVEGADEHPSDRGLQAPDEGLLIDALWVAFDREPEPGQRLDMIGLMRRLDAEHRVRLFCRLFERCLESERPALFGLLPDVARHVALLDRCATTLVLQKIEEVAGSAEPDDFPVIWIEDGLQLLIGLAGFRPDLADRLLRLLPRVNNRRLAAWLTESLGQMVAIGIHDGPLSRRLAAAYAFAPGRNMRQGLILGLRTWPDDVLKEFISQVRQVGSGDLLADLSPVLGRLGESCPTR